MADRSPQAAMRLVFEYDGEGVRLVSQTPVTMVLTDTDPRQNTPGIYVDSRNAENAPLARVRAPGALLESAEVFPQPGRSDERIHRIDQPAAGAFSVVVPAPDAARNVAVVHIAHDVVRDFGVPAPAPVGIASRAITANDGAQATETDIAAFPLRRS